MKDITTICIEKTLREELKGMGEKGETYNDIIRKLIKICH